ncbi:hypothetical protein SAMN05192533_101512 [Mesobacillus persicus]|uniref:Uncharacterized protein n=1 Tax=Mesobacillus persicus TaxID=930146 RepID=A0A1H7WP87_9BACI|nr:hypothetical protein [Mesobacillus persicus]SEM22859.1 hypothetical protein SAMN05192533_101512 [Mesobacillus persicus]
MTRKELQPIIWAMLGTTVLSTLFSGLNYKINRKNITTEAPTQKVEVNKRVGRLRHS